MTRGSDGLSLGERLLQKQIELEEAVRNNQILSLKLERLQVTSSFFYDWFRYFGNSSL